MYGRSSFYEQSEEWQKEQKARFKFYRAKEIYQCPICFRQIKTTANFYKHCRSVHGLIDSEIEQLKTKCKDCAYQPLEQEFPTVSNNP